MRRESRKKLGEREKIQSTNCGGGTSERKASTNIYSIYKFDLRIYRFCMKPSCIERSINHAISDPLCSNSFLDPGPFSRSMKEAYVSSSYSICISWLVWSFDFNPLLSLYLTLLHFQPHQYVCLAPLFVHLYPSSNWKAGKWGRRGGWNAESRECWMSTRASDRERAAGKGLPGGQTKENKLAEKGEARG